ncbi:MAG: hypothetical protein CPDRYMAC_0730 [uncultured Paraburkholderia sp.]|nr:MAG: hypothetical protein CPDRYDRY_0702 [uncultured Paraburkholderia sp.]CAH2913553.1 MAG: hypothetical protein CPDRYMAC_0730 [uncultured Paraburkholderia sp.]
MKLDPKRIEWVSVFIGICVIAIVSPFMWLDVNFYVHSTVTTGEVTKLNHGAYHPQVTFTTDTGERISFLGSSAYPVDVGNPLEVRYIRSAPHTGPRVNQKMNLFDFAPILIGVGFVIAGLRGKLVFFGGDGSDVSKK